MRESVAYLGLDDLPLPHELLLIPSRRIAVCALEMEGQSVLVAHSGFLEILAFAHAVDVLQRFVLNSSMLPEEGTRKLLAGLEQSKYTIIWHAMRDPGVRIPQFAINFPPSLANPWSREMLAMQSFVFAHEAAHLRLHGPNAASQYADGSILDAARRAAALPEARGIRGGCVRGSEHDETP